MTSQARGAGGSPAWRESTDSPSADRDLFDAVLRETESALGSVGDDSDSLLADLRQVARDHAGERFDPESCGSALVRVLLDRQVSRAVAASRIWSQVCRRVADTLCDDPTSRERLERLWNRLQGEIR